MMIMIIINIINIYHAREAASCRLMLRLACGGEDDDHRFYNTNTITVCCWYSTLTGCALPRASALGAARYALLRLLLWVLSFGADASLPRATRDLRRSRWVFQ